MKDAARMVVEAMLPIAALRLPAGGGSPPVDGAVQLTSREMASRLSYFLTDSMPDASLRDAADNDELLDPAALEREARRLIESDAAREAVAAFNAQWLRFDKMDALTKAPDLFRRSAKTSPRRCGRRRESTSIVCSGIKAEPWRRSSPTTARTSTRASLRYTACPRRPAVRCRSSTWARSLRDLDAGRAPRRVRARALRRSGAARCLRARSIALLDASASAGRRQHRLPVLSTDAHQTTRQQLEGARGVVVCHVHDAIDGIGFGFEHFDAVGQWADDGSRHRGGRLRELRGTDMTGNSTAR